MSAGLSLKKVMARTERLLVLALKLKDARTEAERVLIRRQIRRQQLREATAGLSPLQRYLVERRAEGK